MPALNLTLEVKRSESQAAFCTQTAAFPSLTNQQITVIRNRATAWLDEMEGVAGNAGAVPGTLCDIRITALVDSVQVVQRSVLNLKIHRVREARLFENWMLAF